jgi:hypothetical protein
MTAAVVGVVLDLEDLSAFISDCFLVAVGICCHRSQRETKVLWTFISTPG